MNKQTYSTYEERIQEFKVKAKEYAEKHSKLSWMRILLFILFLITVVYFANAQSGSAVLLVSLIFIIAFPLLVRHHNQLKTKRFHIDSLVEINEEEIARLNGKLKGMETGEKFLHLQHPYTGDLDVFGEHSLYQLINRTSTYKGKALLASWLMHPASREEVLSRQQAVQEMKEKLDWRQDFQAHGRVAKENEEDTDALLCWVEEPIALEKRSLYKLAMMIMPLITLAGIIMYFTSDISGYWPIAAIFMNGFILWSTAEKASLTHKKTFSSISALQAYRAMIQSVEEMDFQHKRLQNLKANFLHEGVQASKEISKLEYILDNFNSRGNIFYHIFNIVFLLDVYWLLRADKWKSSLRGDISHWFDSISELETLNSIAGFSFSHPEYVIPDIVDEGYVFEADGLGHCLIDAKKRVNNDFSMQDKGKVCIITGSNMSGKSTFLRTVGINIVLALMGAPVCAKKLKTSVIQVFTSMRTQDSLEESVSSFYAELKRLKQLLQMLEDPQQSLQIPVMYMLDEILKGTNSQDRHNGAASLIKQLSKLPAFGFVSTHDLELGKMEKELSSVINYSFTSTIEQDEIYFDYKIHEGVCKSFNASKLMAKMGIAIEE
ncbi:DNA mismatch repair ATPase MutS [Catalinimonas alkaloidigena]|uniref:MutS-related protein n=1 Tax=Catalinimonas alkaloidigena TaxID=1075417 RepID=UPI002406DFE0|nr:DNA mismatch repair protein MutS [Catalinimonas alkaloidigena]MDF9800544.1 DNA mismatch repair ATPase MutS [Catalinimonas alkaloidigena]